MNKAGHYSLAVEEYLSNIVKGVRELQPDVHGEAGDHTEELYHTLYDILRTADKAVWEVVDRVREGLL